MFEILSEEPPIFNTIITESSIMPQAPRVPQSEWESRKALITDLWIKQNKTLNEVMQYMAALGFCPSKPQWIRKINTNWKLRKNITKEEWQHASSLLSKRKEIGKETDLVMNGKIVPSKKRAKELKRYPTLQADQISQDSSQFPAVVISTPPASCQQEILFGNLPSLHIRDNMKNCSLPILARNSNATQHRTFEVSHVALNHHDLKSSPDKSEPLVPNTPQITEMPHVPEVIARAIEMVDEIFPVPDAHRNKEQSQWPVWVQLFQALLLISTNNLWNVIKTSYKCLGQLMDLVIPNGHLEDLKDLLIGTKEANGEFATHLLFSALKLDSSESLALMRFLLCSGVNPNSTRPKSSPSSHWRTALHDAVYWNSQGSVKLLIEFGADPHPTLSTNLSTSLLIASPEHLHECSILKLPKVANGITFEGCGHCHQIPPLLQALRNGSLHCVQTLLDAGVDPNYFHPSLFTALHCAIGLGDLSMVKLLIKAGALPEIQPSGGLTTRSSSAATVQKPKTVLSPLQAAVRKGSLSIVEYLLYSGASLDRAENKVKSRYGEPYIESIETCLQISATNGDGEMTCFLLESGADPNSRHEDTPTALQTICGSESMTPIQRHDTVSSLLRHGADINAFPKARGGRTALQAAVEVNDHRLADFLLDEGADPNTPATQDGVTAMEAAIKSGSKDLQSLLIEKGALPHPSPVTHERHRRRHFELAIAGASVSLLKSTLGLGKDVMLSLTDEDVKLAIKAAIVGGSLPLVRSLLKRYAPLTNLWVLCEAIWQGKNEIMEWILSWLPPPELNACGCDEPSPLWIALHEKNCYAVRRLLMAGADPNRKSRHICRPKVSSTPDCPKDIQQELELPIRRAILSGSSSLGEDTGMVELLASHGADINCFMDQANTPLLLAVEEGKWKTAQFLLQKGADPDAENSKTKKTSIIYAALTANYSLVESLIDRGADVRASCSWGSPLQALTGYTVDKPPDKMKHLVKTCRLLLDSGADVNTDPTNYCRTTALQTAIHRGTKELVEILLEAGANIHAPAYSDGGETALQAAALTGNFKLVKRLVEMGADINAPPGEELGATTFQYAAISGHVSMAIFLLEHGTSMDKALKAASAGGRLDMVHLLLENDQDLDTVEERCRDSAGIAEQQGFIQIAEFLRGYKRP